MSKLVETLEAFNKRKPFLYKEEGLIKVTENGEICYDTNTKEYVVFEESYAYEVGRTGYPKVAAAMLNTYVQEYL